MCTHACTSTHPCKHIRLDVDHPWSLEWRWITPNLQLPHKSRKSGHLVIKLFSCYGISQDKSDLMKLLVVLVSLLIISNIVITCVYKALWCSIKKKGGMQVNGPFPFLSLEFFFFSNYLFISGTRAQFRLWTLVVKQM